MAVALLRATNSNGLEEDERGASPQYPRPAEIQWKKELYNSVQLIGVVAAPVPIKHLASPSRNLKLKHFAYFLCLGAVLMLCTLLKKSEADEPVDTAKRS